MPQFTPSERALDLLHKRYFMEGEDWEALCRRVATALADGPDRKEEFYQVMVEGLLLPNSPCLINAGKPEGQLSACFVLPVGDSIPEIFDAIKNTAIVHKTGGGTGFNFSTLRPEGSTVKTTKGVSSGPISFMKVFDAATQQMKQGGVRRGANMGMLSINHPDIIKFIKCKHVDKEISNFNISIAMTDGFMDLLTEVPSTPWQTKFGDQYFLVRKSDDQPEYFGPPANNLEVISIDEAHEKYYTVKDIWNLIVQQAWRNGEPGLIFIDEIHRKNGPDVNATNPCVTGDTLLLTHEGYRPIQNLVGRSTWVWNGDSWVVVSPQITGTNQPLLEVEISDGTKIRCTPYHTFILSDGSRVAAEELQLGNKLTKPKLPWTPGPNPRSVQRKLAYTAGFFTGDGSSESSRDRKSIWLYGEKRHLHRYLEYESKTECDGDRDFLVIRPKLLDGGHYYNTWLSKTFVPTVQYSIQSRLDWLAGLIDSDGTLNDDSGSIAISSVDRNFLYNVKLMLSTLGVWSTVGHMKEAERKMMPDGRGEPKEYECQESYRLVISAWNVAKLRKNGLYTYRVPCNPSPNRDAARFPTIVSVTQLPELEPNVYCAHEAEKHQLCFSSVITGNCGEQPLENYEACCLGSIDLSKFVTPTGTWDLEKLEDVVKIGVDMLNNLIDESYYPLEHVEEKVKSSRKIGLGIMGWADALIKRNIKYGCDASIDEASYIMKYIHNTARSYSDAMGYDNKTVTTIAPTGSISIIAGCSSGIEPNIAWITKQSREDFGSQIVVHHLARPYLDEDYEPKNMPSYFVTAEDIDYKQHVDMQAAFQKYVDNAVSKTINLPNDTTEEIVSEAFLRAWEKKCKGVTVYRDGSRRGQVITKAKQEDEPLSAAENALTWEEFTEQMGIPEERPYCLEGFTFKIPIDMGNKKVENAYLVVDHNEGNLYEIFLVGNVREADPIVAQYIDTATRLTSLALRGGIPLDKVIEQLEKVPCSYIYSIPHKIARVLREFLPDDMHDPCPQCQGKVIYSEGCEKCSSCTWAKCG